MLAQEIHKITKKTAKKSKILVLPVKLKNQKPVKTKPAKNLMQ